MGDFYLNCYAVIFVPYLINKMNLNPKNLKSTLVCLTLNVTRLPWIFSLPPGDLHEVRLKLPDVVHHMHLDTDVEQRRNARCFSMLEEGEAQ